MSLSEYQLSDFNNELASYNAQTSNYLATLNEYKQEALEQQQKNEQMASFFEGTGLIGMDVISKIIKSKGFAFVTAYVKKQLDDPNSLPSQFVQLAKGKLKGAVKSSLGIDLDDPKNGVWSSAFDSMKITKDDLVSLSKGDIAPLRQKLQDQFIKTVQEKAPEIVKSALKSQGIDIDGAGSKYKDMLDESGFTLEDLISAGKGDFSPLLTKVEPILRSAVTEKITEAMNLNNSADVGIDSTPIKDIISNLSMNDVKSALSGNFNPALEKLTPVVKQVVANKIKSEYGIDLTDSTNSTPLSVQDIKNAMNGNYDGILDAVKDKAQAYVAQKLKEQTGIDINAGQSKSPINMDDLKNLASGNYKPVIGKYLPQIKQYVGQKIKEQTGIDINADKPSSPIAMEDLQELARGNYTPILEKFGPQVKQFVVDKVKQKTGIDINADQSGPLNMDDVQQLARGNYGPILSKYEPQIRQTVQEKLKQYTGLDLDTSDIPITIQDMKTLAEGNPKPLILKFGPQIKEQLSDHLQSKYGVNLAQYQNDIDDMPITMSDLRSVSQGNYSSVLSKLKTQVEQRTGVSQEDLQQSFDQAKSQVGQARANVEAQVGQARDQLSQVASQAQSELQQQVDDVRSGVVDQLQQSRTLMEAQVQDILPQAGRTQIAFVSNPVFDPNIPPAGSADVSSAFRQGGATIAESAGRVVTATGSELISRLRGSVGAVAGIANLGAQVGAQLGAGEISNTTERNITTVAGSAGASGLISGASRALQGGSLQESLSEGLEAGGEAGLLMGANIGLNYIPDQYAVERFAGQTALNAGMTAMQLSQTATAIQGAVAGNVATTATTATEGAVSGAVEAGTDLATVGADLLTAEVVTAPVDVVPVVGELVQSAIGLAGLGASLYFGLKDLFGSDSASNPPPPPEVGAPSFQSGI